MDHLSPPLAAVLRTCHIPAIQELPFPVHAVGLPTIPTCLRCHLPLVLHVGCRAMENTPLEASLKRPRTRTGDKHPCFPALWLRQLWGMFSSPGLPVVTHRQWLPAHKCTHISIFPSPASLPHSPTGASWGHLPKIMCTQTLISGPPSKTPLLPTPFPLLRCKPRTEQESLSQYLMKLFGLKPERQMAPQIITDFPRKGLQKEKLIWVEKRENQQQKELGCPGHLGFHISTGRPDV